MQIIVMEALTISQYYLAMMQGSLIKCYRASSYYDFIVTSFNSQQFYNLMSNQSNITTHIIQSTVQHIVEVVQDIIRTNQFVKDNLVPYVIDKQHDTVRNLVSQIVFLPRQNVDREDSEARPLSEDNLMGINQIEPNNGAHLDKKQGRNSKNSTHTFLNHHHHPVKKEPYKSIAQTLTQQHLNESNREELIHISKLRDYKEKQRQQQAKSPKDNQKPKIKLIKGQPYIFDYQGNIQKGKERKIQKFNQSIMQTSINNTDKKESKIDDKQKPNKNTIVYTKLDRSVRNRTETTGSIQFLGLQKRDLMINNLKLSNSKTKIVFDGQNITKTQDQASFSNFKIEKRKSSVQEPAIKRTQNNQELSMNISMAHSIQIKQATKRLRFNTQVSERHRNLQRINVENEGLKKVLMTEPEQLYSQLPKNKNRRAVTNKAIQSEINDPDLIRIRERLNIKKSNQKLPKILSRFCNIEKDILRDIRKKSKIPQ